MLIFVGLGLHSENNLTLEGLNLSKKADKIYLDTYTSYMPGLSIQRLEKLVGKKIIPLKRKDLESRKIYNIIEEAKEKNVVLLVPGDPFIATTHIQIRLEAEKRNIKTRIIHSASIYSAIPGETGLSSYKFGRSVTITFPHEKHISETPYEVIKENKLRGLHTLLLLDIDVEKGKFMTIKDAVKILMTIEEKRKENVINPETLVIGVARIGSPNSIVKADFMKNIVKHEFGTPPYTMIIPGKLHFIEAEALVILAKAPRIILNFIGD